MSDAPAVTPRGRLVRSGSRERAATLTTFFWHGLLFASWTAHIPEVKAHLALSNAVLGSILLCNQIGTVCAIVVAGRLLPKLGSPRLVRICLVGYCAAGPLVGLVATPAQMAGAMFVWGAFQGALDVSMNTQAVAVQKAGGGQPMPVFHGTWSVGVLTGAALGVVAVAAHIGVAPQLAILAVPALAMSAVLSSSMVDDRLTGRPSKPRGHVWRNPAVLILGAIALATTLCEGAAADWSAVYLHGVANLPLAASGLGYIAVALAMACVRLLGGRLLRRYRPQPLLAGFALVACAGMSVALASGSGVVGLGGFACLGAGTALIVPAVLSAAGRLPEVPPGLAVATASALGWCGFVCGPPLIGLLASVTGLRVALLVLPTLSLLTAIVIPRTLSLAAAAQ